MTFNRVEALILSTDQDLVACSIVIIKFGPQIVIFNSLDVICECVCEFFGF